MLAHPRKISVVTMEMSIKLNNICEIVILSKLPKTAPMVLITKSFWF